MTTIDVKSIGQKLMIFFVPFREKDAMFRSGNSVRHTANSDVARRLGLHGGAVRASRSCDESLVVMRRGSNRTAIRYVIADDKMRLLTCNLLNR